MTPSLTRPDWGHDLPFAISGSSIRRAASPPARRLHVRVFQALSRAFTPFYQSDSILLPFVRDRLVATVAKVPPAPQLLAAMVADTAPQDLRGTAYGVFNLASGLAMLVASTLAGVLWQVWGAPSTFYAGALFCVLSLMALSWKPAGSS